MRARALENPQSAGRAKAEAEKGGGRVGTRHFLKYENGRLHWLLPSRQPPLGQSAIGNRGAWRQAGPRGTRRRRRGTDQVHTRYRRGTRPCTSSVPPVYLVCASLLGRRVSACPRGRGAREEKIRIPQSAMGGGNGLTTHDTENTDGETPSSNLRRCGRVWLRRNACGLGPGVERACTLCSGRAVRRPGHVA